MLRLCLRYELERLHVFRPTTLMVRTYLTRPQSNHVIIRHLGNQIVPDISRAYLLIHLAALDLNTRSIVIQLILPALNLVAVYFDFVIWFDGSVVRQYYDSRTCELT